MFWLKMDRQQDRCVYDTGLTLDLYIYIYIYNFLLWDSSGSVLNMLCTKN